MAVWPSGSVKETHCQVTAVREADKGQFFALPMVRKCLSPFRADDDDLGFSGHELAIVLAQLRHMPAAERSYEASVKHEDDVLFSAIVG